MKYFEEKEKVDEALGKAVPHTLEKSKKGLKASAAIVSNLEPIEDNPLLHIPQKPVSDKRAKGCLEMAFHNDSREIVKQDIARCIYANGLAFIVV